MFFRKKAQKDNKNDRDLPRIEVMNEVMLDADEYLWEAAKILVERKYASIGILQSTLKIGFSRASSIMEQLFQIGVVGDIKEDKISREILVDKNGLIQIAERIKKLSQSVPSTKENHISGIERVNMYNNQYDYMIGEDFEIFVANILKNIGFINMQFTKGSGDQGVDILAEKDGIKYAIQCKRYSQAVGNKAVQEVFAGKFYYHCHVGAVITNNYFTQSAKDLAKENGIVLWDRRFINQYLDKYSSVMKTQKETASGNIEKIYYINDDFVDCKFTNNKVEILAICHSSMSAANLYLTCYTKLKDDWLGRIDFAVAVEFEGKNAIASNEENVEFFGGKEENGKVVAGIPDWMDKARDELLSGDKNAFMQGIVEIHKYLDEFMQIVMDYID